MNIAISQLNFKIADFEVNTQKICNHINLATAQGADLIIFPELAIGGSPAFDLLKSSKFIASVNDAINRIVAHCSLIDCIIGAPYQDPKTGKLLNSALFIQASKISAIVSKNNLRSKDEVIETPY